MSPQGKMELLPLYWPRFGRLESFHRRFLTQEVGEQAAGDDGGESREPAEQRRQRHAPARCQPHPNMLF